MRKTVLSLFALSAFIASADARLGETLAQCRERYGVMSLEPNPAFPALPGHVFQKNGFKITIRFVDGKAVWISYVSAKPFEQGVIDTLLDLNAGESKWIFNEPLTEKAATASVRKDERYSRKDREADARYQDLGTSYQLVIATKTYHRTTNPELEGL